MSNNLVKGAFVKKPSSNAPEFVKAKVSFNKSFIDYLNENANDKGYVNVDLLESKEGKLYFKLDDFVPNTATTPSVDNDSDLPF